MKKEKEIIYYQDEQNDDFAKSKIEPIKIDKNYKYIRKNFFWRICAFTIHKIILPLPVYIYTKLKFKLKFENKKVLKECKKEGYFVYCNHTQEIEDTFFPSLANFPKKVYIVAHPNNVSIKYMKTLNKMLGALPIPGDIGSSKNFLEAIKYYINKKKNVITIYPEAHVWPYYTKIRPYNSTSFKYPVELNKPSYCFTTTYQRVNNKNRCKIVIYIDGPFYPNQGLNKKQAQEELKEKILETMNKRSKNSNYEKIEYIKKNIGEQND